MTHSSALSDISQAIIYDLRILRIIGKKAPTSTSSNKWARSIGTLSSRRASFFSKFAFHNEVKIQAIINLRYFHLYRTSVHEQTAGRYNTPPTTTRSGGDCGGCGPAQQCRIVCHLLLSGLLMQHRQRTFTNIGRNTRIPRYYWTNANSTYVPAHFELKPKTKS